MPRGMSEDLRDLLERFRETARTEREKGTYFERIAAVYLRHDPMQAALFAKVETYEEWAKGRGEDAADSGIDLVATLADRSGFCAVQCKFYEETKKVDKGDIDSFFTASGKEGFVRRLIVDTSDGNWTDRAEKALQGQTIPTNRIGLSDLEASPILWSDFVRTGEVRVSEAKTLRPHQEEALEAVRAGLEEADRGKLILACGTGKTFTSLRIAEDLVGTGGMVLFMVPSLALMSQAVREWTNDAALPLRSFAVCSDAKVGKRQGRQDTADIAVHDLAYPATTNGAALAEKMADDAPEAMTVVFATYQSIQVISAAQEAGLGAFGLIVCDEAHRTTGVTTGEEDESNFVRIHSDEHVRAAKRLYMTATPRIYGEAARQRAKEQSLTLAQMDDPATYGETLFERGFSWAVEKGLLVDYKVIVLAVDEGKVARSVQRRLESADSDLMLDDATKIVGCYKALTKTDLKVDVGTDTGAMQRALIFCRDIKSSRIIEGEFAAVAEEFRGQNPDDALTLDCEVRHVDGTFNADSRGRLLDWLKANPGDDNCRILTNARCLSEGVDVPALDAIMFLHPRKSQIDVVQSVGRVMRQTPDRSKKMGYVILPVAIPAGTSPEEALNDNERYRVVWQILNALRSHDERLDGDINKIHLGQTEGSRIEIVAVAPELPGQSSSSGGPGIGQGSAPGDDEGGGGGRGTSQGELFVDEFSAAIRAQIVKKCGTKEYWDRWAADIARIAERHITRIEALLEHAEARATFDAFLKELHDDLNEAISEADAIEMLAQHVITRPVFESLFQGNRFTDENPISRAMQGIVARLDEAQIDRESESLEEFYASVRRRAEGLTDPAAKQKLIVQLYDDFFKSAFPRTTKRMGVVYTPVEIVDFILHSVDEALQRDFGVGIGAEGVHVIDPFTGTGTFITRLLQSGLIAPEDLARKYREELHANEIILLAYYIAAINIETVYADLVGEGGRAGGLRALLRHPADRHLRAARAPGPARRPAARQCRASDAPARARHPGDRGEPALRRRTRNGREQRGRPLSLPKARCAGRRHLRSSQATRSTRPTSTTATCARSAGRPTGWARTGASSPSSLMVAFRRQSDSGGAALPHGRVQRPSHLRPARQSAPPEAARARRAARSSGKGRRLLSPCLCLPSDQALLRRGRSTITTSATTSAATTSCGSCVSSAASAALRKPGVGPGSHRTSMATGSISGTRHSTSSCRSERSPGEPRRALFDLYSHGVVTHRDAWAVNSSRADLVANIGRMIETYNRLGGPSTVERRDAPSAGGSTIHAGSLGHDPRAISTRISRSPDLDARCARPIAPSRRAGSTSIRG